jgi:membrane protease subunit (stomatin/prohibitin family)
VSFFGKNQNETAFVGGKKHWADVIKNSGPGELLIWRQPEEDFNINSTLIVMPGEEAILIKGGVIEQTFDNGTYKLSTEDYPVISRLQNFFTGGVSTFNCVVYFIRKAHSMEILWGTSSPIQVRDKLLDIVTTLCANGSYKIQIDNPQKFLTTLLGNNIDIMEQQSLFDNYLTNEFQSQIKSSITRALNETQTELVGIEAHIEEIAQTIEPSLGEILEGYGLKMIKFSIAMLKVVDNPFRTIDEMSRIEAIVKVRDAKTTKGVMDTLGNNWGTHVTAKLLEIRAANPGAVGAPTVGPSGENIYTSLMPPQPSAAAPQSSGRFTQKIADASSVPSGGSDDSAAALKNLKEMLEKLKEMLDGNLITQSEFDAMRAEILSRMTGVIKRAVI